MVRRTAGTESRGEVVALELSSLVSGRGPAIANGYSWFSSARPVKYRDAE